MHSRILAVLLWLVIMTMLGASVPPEALQYPGPTAFLAGCIVWTAIWAFFKE